MVKSDSCQGPNPEWTVDVAGDRTEVRGAVTHSCRDRGVRVIATDRASLDQELDAAVEAIKAVAMTDRSRGILVTRVGSDSFDVTLCASVPFGLTRELQDW